MMKLDYPDDGIAGKYYMWKHDACWPLNKTAFIERVYGICICIYILKRITVAIVLTYTVGNTQILINYAIYKLGASVT
jgi:hypothetical protein